MTSRRRRRPAPVDLTEVRRRLAAPTAGDAADAADRIRERRYGLDEPTFPPDHPGGMPAYIYRHPHPEDVTADVGDALVILAHHRAQHDRDLHAVLTLARTTGGLRLTDLAEMLGLNSPQAAAQYLARLDAAIDGYPKDERIGRAARRVRTARTTSAARRAAPAAPGARQGTRAALVTTSTEDDRLLREWAAELAGLASGVADRDTAAEAERELRRWPLNTACPPAVDHALRFLLADLRGRDLTGRLAALVAAARDRLPPRT